MSEREGPDAGAERTDVVIVGAGPTGLLAAGLLLRCGVSVRLLDKSPGPAKESRALALQARSLELLLSLGLDAAFLDKGVILNGLAIVVDGKPAVSVSFDDIGRQDTPYPFPLIIPQSETEAILAADVESCGVAIAYGVEVLGFEQNDTGVTVQAQDGARRFSIEAAYLIGADGAHSIVRKTLGLSFEGAAYAQTFFLADCTVDWSFGRDAVCLFVHGREFAAFLPMRGEARGRIIAIDPSDGDPQASVDQQGAAPASLTEIETVLRRVTRSDVTLRDPIWTSRYRVHHRGVDRYRVGRAFVAGDAAHIHSPAGGQGMNTGLQDAANLAWKLAAVLKGGAADALLDSYHDERWPVGRKVLERTDRMFTTMTSLSPLAAEVRNFALPFLAGPVMRSRTARARAFRFISELGIRYEPNAFVADPAAERHRVRAGSRAPDGRISRTRSVFDLLAGYRFTLLALSWTALDEAAIARVVAMLGAVPETLGGSPLDRHLVARSLIGRDPRLIVAELHDVFESYEMSAAVPTRLLLVRPDGYIASAADDLSGDGLAPFLARFTP